MAFEELKKGDTVIGHLFTGLPMAVWKVTKVTQGTISVETKKGTMVFDRSTGVQIVPKPSEKKYANSIVEDDGSFVPVKLRNKRKRTVQNSVDKVEKSKRKRKTKKKRISKSTKVKPDPDINESEYSDCEED